MAEENEAKILDGENKVEEPKTPEAPKVVDGGDVVVPSNVIDGIFEGKRAAAKEAEKIAAEMDKGETAPSEKKGRGGSPPKAEKPPKAPKEKNTASVGGGGVGGSSGQTPDKGKTPSVPAIPEAPKDATRPGKKETIVYIDHSELHPFKDHPFQVRNDNDIKSLVDSIKERGFDQAALVRPREGGGYELVAGHRRQQAAILAG